MSYSDYKKDKLLMENWRGFVNEGFFDNIKKAVGMGGLGLKQEVDRLEANLDKFMKANAGLKMINFGYLDAVPADDRLAKRLGRVQGANEGMLLRYIKSRGSGSNWKTTYSVPGAAQNLMYTLAQYVAHGTQSGAMSGYSREGQSTKDVARAMSKFRSKHAEKFGLRGHYSVAYLRGMGLEHLRANIKNLEANKMGHGQQVKDALVEMNGNIEELAKNLSKFLLALSRKIGSEVNSDMNKRKGQFEPIYGQTKTVSIRNAATAMEWAKKTSEVLGS